MAVKRLAYLDALRGFAILAVIFTHAAQIADVAGPLRTLSDLGGRGVQLFFVISAFTIFLTFDKAVATESAPVRNFFIRRLMRIVPVYWAGILLYTAIYGLGSRGWREGPELWHYPLHLTLTNLLAPTATSSVVPGGWSISCEVLFYLTVPIWFVLVRNLRTAVAFTVACVLITPIVLSVLQHVAAPAMAHLDAKTVDQYWFRSFPSQLGCFSFGILLFYLLKSEAIKALLSRPLTPLALFGAGLAIFAAVFLRPPYLLHHHQSALSFMLFALALSKAPWAVLVNPATILMGRVSYSAYLVHFLVLEFTNRLLLPGLSSPTLKFAAALALSILVTTPIAYVSFRFVEAPTSNLAKRWIATLEAGRAGQATARV